MICSLTNSLEIFQLCRNIRVMTANLRSAAWPLSDMCNVTANQRSTGQRSLQCSPNRRVNRSKTCTATVYDLSRDKTWATTQTGLTTQIDPSGFFYANLNNLEGWLLTVELMFSIFN